MEEPVNSPEAVPESNEEVAPLEEVEPDAKQLEVEHKAYVKEQKSVELRRMGFVH